jgi:hypothetical protein
VLSDHATPMPDNRGLCPPFEPPAKVQTRRGPRGVVENSTDATLEVEFWIAINEAAEQLDPPLED